MSVDNLDQLQKGTPKSVATGTKGLTKYERMRKGVLAICETLAVSTSKYNAEVTEAEIVKFIHAEKGTLRIFYSEINIQLMNMTLEGRGIFYTNIEKLLSFVLEKEKQEADVIKIVLKIYDHTQLVINQIKNVDETLSPRLDEAKIAMKNKMKLVEREYITILGIFAAIMLAFVGSYTFSTSVLNNIGRASTSSLFIIASINRYYIL